MSETQVCIRCKRELPKTKDYFFQLKEGVLRTRCKECFGNAFTNKVASKEGYRICQVCKKELPLTEEYYAIRNDTQTPTFRWKCRQCKKKERSDFWNENMEKLSAQHKTYYNENRDKILSQQKKDRDENPEKYRERNSKNYFAHKSERQASNKRWREENKEKIQEYRQKNKYRYREWYRNYYQTPEGKAIILKITGKKRSNKKNLLSTLTEQDWKDCLENFNNSCSYCGSDIDLQQDHVVPLSKGGFYVRSNIVPACQSCNSSKHARNMETWYRPQPFFSESRLKKILKWTGLKPNSKIQQVSLF